MPSFSLSADFARKISAFIVVLSNERDEQVGQERRVSPEIQHEDAVVAAILSVQGAPYLIDQVIVVHIK